MSPKLSNLSVKELSTLLKQSGAAHANEETIQTHIKRGAPTNADGTVHFVHYCAWLTKEYAHGS